MSPLLARFLAQPGERCAILEPGGIVWSFDDVLACAVHLAQRLHVFDVAGRVVLMRTGPGPLFSVADLAVLLAGAVPAVVPELTERQLAELWPILDPAAVIDATDETGPLAAAADRTGTTVHRISACRPRAGMSASSCRALARCFAAARWEPTGALVFTSGTTGTPRALALEEQALVRAVDSWSLLWPARPLRTVSYLPVSHIAQRIMGHTLMCLYGTTVIASSPGRLAEDLVAHRPDTLLGVPRIWARLAAVAARDDAAGRALTGALAAVRTAVNGAAALDPAVAADLHCLAGMRIAGAYGASETTAPVFHQPDAARPGLGVPVGVEHRISSAGELQLRGDNLAPGYVEQWPRLSPVAGPDGWWHTGDLARRGPDGLVHLAGRLAAAFKTSRGEMISPEPVEAHLAAHPRVLAACLIGHGLPAAIALVCAPETATWPPARVTELEHDLCEGAHAARDRGEVPFHDLAAVHVICDPWPAMGLVTSTGKVRRREIAEAYPHLLTAPEDAHACT